MWNGMQKRWRLIMMFVRNKPYDGVRISNSLCLFGTGSKAFIQTSVCVSFRISSPLCCIVYHQPVVQVLWQLPMYTTLFGELTCLIIAGRTFIRFFSFSTKCKWWSVRLTLPYLIPGEKRKEDIDRSLTSRRHRIRSIWFAHCIQCRLPCVCVCVLDVTGMLLILMRFVGCC